MIKKEELNQIDNIDVVEKIYEELMLDGVNAIPASVQDTRTMIFSKVCHDLVQQYLKWNDYVHSNNIMQLFKNYALSINLKKKPGWIIRYEIII